MNLCLYVCFVHSLDCSTLNSAPFHHLHDLDLVLDLSGHIFADALFQFQNLESFFGSVEIDPNVFLRLGAATALLDTGRGDPFDLNARDVG